MTASAHLLKPFFLRSFLWLPLCSVVWYFSAGIHTAFVGRLARLLANLLTGGVVSALERTGLDLVFVTTITVHPGPGQTAVLAPEVNPLLYTYGLALFAALMLAERAKWWKFLAGFVVLLPFQSWGIAFDALSQGMQAGQAFSEHTGFAGRNLIAVAICFQLGALIFPTLVPVMLWAAFSELFAESVRSLQLRSS